VRNIEPIIINDGLSTPITRALADYSLGALFDLQMLRYKEKRE